MVCRVEFLNTDGEHEHDTSVSSVSIVQDELLDLGSAEDWIRELLRTKGADVYRMKGVLHVNKHGVCTHSSRTPLCVPGLPAQTVRVRLPAPSRAQPTRSTCTTPCT